MGKYVSPEYQEQLDNLAEKICQFLNIKYGEGTSYALNGQSAISRYLTDLYAQDYDFAYLLGENSGSDYFGKTKLLHSFVF